MGTRKRTCIGRGRPRRDRRARLRAWLGVCALLLHGIIPLGQDVPFARGEGGQPGPSGLLVACKTYGPQASPFGEGGGHSRKSAHSSCAICQIQCLGQTLVGAAPLAHPVPELVGHAPAVETGSDAVAARRTPPWFARAPPLPA